MPFPTARGEGLGPQEKAWDLVSGKEFPQNRTHGMHSNMLYNNFCFDTEMEATSIPSIRGIVSYDT